jgi:hypothetical protein
VALEAKPATADGFIELELSIDETGETHVVLNRANFIAEAKNLAQYATRLVTPVTPFSLVFFAQTYSALMAYITSII